MKASIATILTVLLILLFAAPGQGEADGQEGWSDKALAIASKIPVQDGGRVKPLGTYARYKLLSMNGRSSVKLPDGRKLSAMEWLLDTLFFPERARTYESFLVQNSEVLDAIGLEYAGKKKRDRHSYVMLAPGREKLMQLANEYIGKSRRDEELSSTEKQILALATNIRGFEQLTDYVAFGRKRFPVADGPALSALFDAAEGTTVSQVLAHASDLRKINSESRTKPGGEAAARAIARLVRDVTNSAAPSKALPLFPPSAPAAKIPEWMDPESLSQAALFAGVDLPEQIGMLSELEGMASVLAQEKPDYNAFEGHLAEFQLGAMRLADARGEYASVELEDTYYRSGLLHWSLGFFVIGFLFVAATWLAPRFWVLNLLSGFPLLIALGALVAAITIRCVIRSRPPVTTLYETILFITAVVVCTGLVVELLTRRRIAISAAAILGMIGIFLAGRYEVSKAVDTMPTLVAVLDTNFWLSTHVTTIAIGYAGGLLAAAIAHVYIFGKLIQSLFGLKISAGFFRGVTRMVYGVTAFGLLFAIVGTLLGGIWANESWGRFWGWDPKENGALLICIWMLMMLHARHAGYVKGLGFSIAAIFLGMIVVFSWWGVNLLNVGLHTYGFESGIALIVRLVYVYGFAVMGLGGLAGLLHRVTATAAQPPATPPVTPV